MARKFLHVVALLITLAVIGMISFSFFGNRLMQSVLVPHGSFAMPAPLPSDFYQKPDGWIARPDDRATDPTRWQPQGIATAHPGKAAIFFIHPTSAFQTTRWNAGMTDPVSAAQTERFLRMQASAFAASGAVWAPRYRQAVFGAFLTEKPDAKRAIDLAYADIAEAFRSFLKANPTGPLILAGHSQGTLHLLRLLAERVGGTDYRSRIVAVYAPGWPISVTHDLPALGLPACSAARQTGCILSWQSFGSPADTSALDQAFERAKGFDGQSRTGSPMLCTNPLTGGASPIGPAAANQGVLLGDGDPTGSMLIRPGNLGAKCSGQGILLLDNAPRIGPAVMPGNNYHAYDYSLFWANIRADALERLAAWQTTH